MSAEELDGFPSYAAARNYEFDRDAPADYIARVAAVFGYDLEWLVFGTGSRFSASKQEEAVQLAQDLGEIIESAVGAALTEAFPPYPRLSPGTRLLLRSQIWHLARLGSAGDPIPHSDAMSDATEQVAKVLRYPVATLAPTYLDSGWHAEQYALAICQVLEILRPPHVRPYSFGAALMAIAGIPKPTDSPQDEEAADGED